MEKENVLTFRGSRAMAFLPVAIFFAFCILFFVILKAFEMHALAMAAFVALLVGSLTVKKEDYENYWTAVYKGISESIPIVVLLLIIGMFSALIKLTNLSAGFVWIAHNLHVSGGAFTAITFISVCIIATATGSSIGTLFTCFPIFYAAGILVGCNPAALSAAIVCGGIFGDNLAPISDTTIISAGTQHYKHSESTADIGGCVFSRLKYSLIAGAISVPLFWLVGGHTATLTSSAVLVENMNAKTLIMLLPVALMLYTSIKTKSIYKAIIVGLVSGTIVGLVFGLITTKDILYVDHGMPKGFFADGLFSMMGTVTLVMSVYGIMGVLAASKVLDSITGTILNSSLGKTVRGAEFAMMIGITLNTLLFGGVTSASIATFGKIQNELGQKMNLHPYRRANLLDGFANGIALAVPFLSVFVFIGSALTGGYDTVAPLSVTQVAPYMMFSFVFFAVLCVSVITGWGRTFEGENGEAVKK